MVNSKAVHGVRSEIDDWLRGHHRTQLYPWWASQSGHTRTLPVIWNRPRSKAMTSNVYTQRAQRTTVLHRDGGQPDMAQVTMGKAL